MSLQDFFSLLATGLGIKLGKTHVLKHFLVTTNGGGSVCGVQQFLTEITFPYYTRQII